MVSGAWQRPADSDNPLGAWYVRTGIQGAPAGVLAGRHWEEATFYRPAHAFEQQQDSTLASQQGRGKYGEHQGETQ